MPFTFSHPSIVLPIYNSGRGYFSLTGLIVGSMVPDFEYFLRLKVKSIYSHTLSGVLWFDLPIALFTCYLFHSLVRMVIIPNLPRMFYIRFSKYVEIDWRNMFRSQWHWISFSCVLGILSHLFWDGFTHSTGFFVTLIPVLQNEIFLGQYSWPFYKLIQHASSLVGGIVIIYYFYLLPVRNSVHYSPSIIFWLVSIAVAFVLLALRFYFGLGIDQVGNWVVSAISGCFLGVTFASYLSRRLKVLRATSACRNPGLRWHS
jgi:hypothetical protein